jgi:hypothetical protein
VESIRYAMEHARPGSFIVLCSEDVKRSISYVQELMQMEKTGRSSMPA